MPWVWGAKESQGNECSELESLREKREEAVDSRETEALEIKENFRAGKTTMVSSAVNPAVVWRLDVPPCQWPIRHANEVCKQ